MTVPDLGFTLDRTYSASPERVYAHFTDPGLMARWFCPNPDLPTTCELDVRPGGAWRVEMGDWVVGGTYVEVEPVSRLVFTFDWEHDDDRPTTVTVVITEESDGTRLVLAHEETGADGGHQVGWTASFVRLDRELA
ncbi:SRPBCC family protein [Nocardioides halotolerans]|uniref:SRPBCC family protein n=1 Tax=Nocardioides halotolerans TaxID=433660 RepID=UPI00040801C3|nr:SRPBCC domain-containing protein [Nocardioides halotolerans]